MVGGISSGKLPSQAVLGAGGVRGQGGGRGHGDQTLLTAGGPSRSWNTDPCQLAEGPPCLHLPGNRTFPPLVICWVVPCTVYLHLTLSSDFVSGQLHLPEARPMSAGTSAGSCHLPSVQLRGAREGVGWNLRGFCLCWEYTGLKSVPPNPCLPGTLEPGLIPK